MYEHQLRDLRRMGLSAFREEQFCSALVFLRLYLEHCPDDGYPCYAYGEILRLVGDQSESYKCLQHSLALAPTEYHGMINIRLAQIEHRLGQFRKAELHYEFACKCEEESRESWLWVLRGGNLAVAGSFELAESYHRHAIALDDTNDEAHLNLGYVLRALRRYEEAAESFRRVLSLDPNNPDALTGLKTLEGASDAVLMTESVSERNQLDTGNTPGKGT